MEAGLRSPNHRGMQRAILVCLGALLFLCAQAPEPPLDASTVIATLAQRNAAVKHFTFDVDAHIALLTFPWIRFELKGHGVYTRGSEYMVHFDSVPWFGKAYDTMDMSALDPANWRNLYTMDVGDQEGDTTVLVMHDVKRSRLRDAHATIDPTKGLQEILWTYDYGGHVKLKIDQGPVEGHYFPDTEEAEIVMPAYRAMAWAKFSNYQVVTDESNAQ